MFSSNNAIAALRFLCAFVIAFGAMMTLYGLMYSFKIPLFAFDIPTWVIGVTVMYLEFAALSQAARGGEDCLSAGQIFVEKFLAAPMALIANGYAVSLGRNLCAFIYVTLEERVNELGWTIEKKEEAACWPCRPPVCSISRHLDRPEETTPATTPATTATTTPATAPATTAAAAPDPHASEDPTGASVGSDFGLEFESAKAPGKPTADEQLAQISKLRGGLNMLWTCLAGFLVFFMQAGFALVETGFARAKNAAHTMGMNMMVFCIGFIGYYICGFAFMFGRIWRQPAHASGRFENPRPLPD